MATKEEPDWLRLQKKIFGRYVNQKFRQAGIKLAVNDLVSELKNGLTLIQLVEVLSGKQFPGKKPAEGKQRIQQIDACNKAIQFVKECGIKTQTSAEDVVDANEKLVLGMIFQVIIKYLKFEDDDGNSSGDVKEALMLWLKNKTGGYKGVLLENFTKSFHDGLAFCALIHKMRPKLIPYDTLNASDKLKNLTYALNTAEKYCNVEKYLEPTDIPKLDELAMIVYLSDWYYGVALLQKQDIAARRIGKLVLMTQLHDKMRADYSAGAVNLKTWIENKIKELNDRTIDNTLAGAKARLEKFYDYKTREKSDAVVKNMDLEALFDNLAIRLQNNKRPPFRPEITLEALGKKFSDLDFAESEKSKALHTELARQIRLHNTAGRLRQDAQKLVGIYQEQQSYFDTKETIDSVEQAEYHLDVNSHHITEVQHHKETRLQELKKVAAELYQEKFEQSSEIKKTEADLDTKFANLLVSGDRKKKTLTDELNNQKTINDNLCKEFAEAVRQFNEWLGQKKAFIANKSGSLEEQLANLVKSTSDNSTADQKLKKLADVDAKVTARQITNNPYTTTTSQDCVAQWNQFKLLLAKKKELLEQQIEESKKSGLTDEQLQEIKDNFAYFDRDHTNYLDKRELRACLQSLGEDATPEEVGKVMKKYDIKGEGRIFFEQFQQFMFLQLGDSNTIEEIQQAFKYLSYDKETITEENLTSVINDVSFKDRHVAYLTREMTPKSGGYDWPKWTKEVFDR